VRKRGGAEGADARQVVSVDANEGEAIVQGQQLIVMEAMKMEHVLAAPVGGVLRRVVTAKGETVAEGQPLLFIDEYQVDSATAVIKSELDLDAIRPDLAEVLERHEIGLDVARPQAVARRRKTGQRTARKYRRSV
jgi:pyruvate/2-oxoglutarate dehydrogenase complex dihydrolipoamide acyltransferase (E2) component